MIRAIVVPVVLLAFLIGCGIFLYLRKYNIYLQIGNGLVIAYVCYVLLQVATRQLSCFKGNRVICEGIAFYLDPENSRLAYGASPSQSTSNERIELVVSEVMRILPDFLSENKDLRHFFRGRQLSIRLLDDYQNVHDNIKHEQSTDHFIE